MERKHWQTNIQRSRTPGPLHNKPGYPNNRQRSSKCSDLSYQHLHFHLFLCVWPYWSIKQTPLKTHPNTQNSMAVIWANADNKQCYIGAFGWHTSPIEPHCLPYNLSWLISSNGACFSEKQLHSWSSIWPIRLIGVLCLPWLPIDRNPNYIHIWMTFYASSTIQFQRSAT